jgi:transcriptional regulator with XRE-family HTH domain
MISITSFDEAAAVIALLPPHRLGSMLRAQRKHAHVSAPAAARAAGIEISTLKQIESGRTTPDATVLAALLNCYHVTAAEFVPPRAALETTTSEATSDEILRGYVDVIRKWRESGRKDKLNFRANDLLTLGPGALDRSRRDRAASHRAYRLQLSGGKTAAQVVPRSTGHDPRGIRGNRRRLP